MKNYIIICLALFTTLANKYCFAQPPNNDPAYTLVWADSFKTAGVQIDTNKWEQKWGWNQGDSVALCGCDGQYHDISYYKWYKPITPAPIVPASYPPDTTNCKKNNGLTMYTRRETYSGNCWTWPSCPPNTVCNAGSGQCVNGTCWHAQYKQFAWTSAMLKSKYKFKYGYFEIKFTLPAAPPAGKNYRCGPAFWMYDADCSTVPWSEIDIFEIRGSDNFYTSNIHYTASPDTCNNPNNPLHNEYYQYGANLVWGSTHTAGCLWTGNEIDFYLDGQLIHQMQNKDINPANMLAMPIIVDLGGPNFNFNQYFDANSVDYTYKVDYVKVWQMQHDCSSARIYCGSSTPFNPATYVSKLYQSVAIDGGSCADAVTNTNFVSVYGNNYVLLDAGFSVDNNSTALFDVQDCPANSFYYVGAAPPAPAQAQFSNGGSSTGQ